MPRLFGVRGFTKDLIMKTDIQKKADHIKHLVKCAKDAGIEVIINVPNRLN